MKHCRSRIWTKPLSTGRSKRKCGAVRSSTCGATTVTKRRRGRSHRPPIREKAKGKREKDEVGGKSTGQGLVLFFLFPFRPFPLERGVLIRAALGLVWLLRLLPLALLAPV